MFTNQDRLTKSSNGKDHANSSSEKFLYGSAAQSARPAEGEP